MKPRALAGHVAAWAVLCCTVAACAPAGSPANEPAIALVHRRQCGRCHAPPETGKHDRPYLEEALAPHRKRVHMSEDEWAQMIDYLAAQPGEQSRR